ncbi:MAG: polymerase [Chloroflexi bacterium]|nr:polymerase [Chloroflexota bacterium]
MPPTLYLIDGHALAYRTYYALTRGSPSGFTTRAGEPTAGVFGFASVLLRLLEQDKPEFLAVAFDTGRTFRDDLFADYKGTRAKMPDDLAIQIDRIRQLVDAFNIPRLEIENYEADDVLGSVARQVVGRGLGVRIITGDRDLLQLVNERVIVSLPGKSLSDSRDYLPQDVQEDLGIRPDQVVDYKALVGDKSDNIPGVAGIGEKTAVSLLQTYQTLDGIYKHLAEVGGSVQKKLEAGHDAAYLSRTLATIVCDLEVPLDLERARPEHFDPAQVEALFRELEFRALMPRLTALEQDYGKRPASKGQQLSMFAAEPAAQPEIQAAPVEPHSYTLVDTPQALQALIDRLTAAAQISFDTETTSTDQMRADLVGISLAVEPGHGYYIPVGHVNAGRQLPLADVLDALRGPMTDPRLPKVGHNAKYDFVVLARQGLRVAPLAFDSMIAEWLIDPNSRNLGLKNLAWVRQDIRMTSIDELIGKGKNQLTMAQVPIEAAGAYAAADAEVVLRLIPELEHELGARNVLRLFHDLEMPLVTVLADMEMAGIALDTAFLAQMSGELSLRLRQLEDQVYQKVGEPFNLNSTQQLSDALFIKLKLEPPDRRAKTASGHYSTSAEVLEALRGKHPVVDWILEYRELSKLKSTYLDALPLQVNPVTGRVHTSYNQTGSVTGRIASSDPNLQNIPIRTELGRQVRRAFVASPGNLLLSVDYSQVELRIAAHMSNDEAMLATFRAGQDIHAATAAAVYGIPLSQVTPEQRRRAKGINFGLIYGISAFGLTRQTDLTLAESENFMQAYFQQFPGVKRYLDGMRRLAAEQGYVETLLGRRRYFPGLKSQGNPATRGREEREAINAPIQGTAADIMKIAMLHVPTALAQHGLQARMLLQVHDELVIECPVAELPSVASVVQSVMENAYALDVPLETEARSGPSWGEMQPLSR